jgi:hypothetical protein
MPASAHFVARYEELRRQHRNYDTDHAMGMSLLMHHGMKAWVDAWSRCMPDCPKPELYKEETISSDVQSDMTIILAGMVLHAWEKEARC